MGLAIVVAVEVVTRAVVKVLIQVLAIEIDGYKDHRSYRALRKDQQRTIGIQGAIKDVEDYRLGFWQLKNCPDDLISSRVKADLT